MVDTIAFGPQVIVKRQVHACLNRFLLTSCQLVLFLATFHDQVKVHIDKFALGANKIKLKRNEMAMDVITQFYLNYKNEGTRYNTLVSLYYLLMIGHSTIFCSVSDPWKFSEVTVQYVVTGEKDHW